MLSPRFLGGGEQGILVIVFIEGYVISFLGCDFQWRMVVLANRHLEPKVDEELTVWRLNSRLERMMLGSDEEG